MTQESPLLEFPLVAPVDRLEEAVKHTSIDEVSIDEASKYMIELQDNTHLRLTDEHVLQVGLSMEE